MANKSGGDGSRLRQGAMAAALAVAPEVAAPAIVADKVLPGGIAKWAKWTAVVAVALLVLGGCMLLSVFGAGSAAAASESCAVTAPGGVPAGPGEPVAGSNVTLDAEQISNARTIMSVVAGYRAHGTGSPAKLPGRAAVIALATAKQESQIKNINYGDADSLGLFQQRPSQGWGSPEQIMDPVYSTTKFLDRLLIVPEWQTLPVTVAAQAVQSSGAPTAYARWETMAAALADKYYPGGSAAGGTVPDVGTGPGATSAADAVTCQGGYDLPPNAPDAEKVKVLLDAASRQQGLPYVWGGGDANGPTNGQTGPPGGFDCSGLTLYAYAQIGVMLPHSADAQWNMGPRVPAGADGRPQLQAGDLVFWDNESKAGIDHVALYAGNNEIWVASTFGQPLAKKSMYYTDGFVGGTRPLLRAATGKPPVAA